MLHEWERHTDSRIRKRFDHFFFPPLPPREPIAVTGKGDRKGDIRRERKQASESVEDTLYTDCLLISDSTNHAGSLVPRP